MIEKYLEKYPGVKSVVEELEKEKNEEELRIIYTTLHSRAPYINQLTLAGFSMELYEIQRKSEDPFASYAYRALTEETHVLEIVSHLQLEGKGKSWTEILNHIACKPSKLNRDLRILRKMTGFKSDKYKYNVPKTEINKIFKRHSPFEEPPLTLKPNKEVVEEIKDNYLSTTIVRDCLREYCDIEKKGDKLLIYPLNPDSEFENLHSDTYFEYKNNEFYKSGKKMNRDETMEEISRYREEALNRIYRKFNPKILKLRA